MIKSLSSITDISVINQNNEKDILSFSKIEFDDSPIGSGGFGTVHNVQSIDGVSKSDFVLKIFTDEEHKQHAYDVIKILHDKLKKRQEKTKRPTYHDIPELLGLPFIVFKGYDAISEKHCVAFLMFNLVEFNYEDYGSDTSNLEDFKSLSIPDKLYLGYQLAKTIDFLHQIEFIHSDLSENSLWFNSERIQLAIIDYDSGYHFDSQGKPTTVGKVGHWIGSRFRNIIGQKKNTSGLTTLDRLYEEYWVLANATFEVLFGVMPFFFLSDSDDNTKQSYLKTFEWPNIDYNSPLFNKQNTQQHITIIAFIEQLENAGADELITAFKTVFNKGYANESNRLTSKQWKDLLLNLNQSLENNPLIKSFNSDKTTINKRNEEVLVSFHLQKYNTAYINNKLINLNKEELRLPINDDSKITLKAINDFKTVEAFIDIKAIKLKPKILKFEASNNFRDSLSPINLKWEVENANSVTISNQASMFPISGNLDVEPRKQTTYTLTVNGFFDEKITQELTIEVVKPIIKSFKYVINLNEGIDNVDLTWETENTQRVKIIPYVEHSNPNGLAHVPIDQETKFKLIAKGLFSDVEKELTAHPFPVPVVKQILAEAPKVEMHANIDYSAVNISKELLNLSNIQFANSVSFNNLEIDSTELKDNLKFPEFEYQNAIMDKYSKEHTSLLDIYNNIIKYINKRLINEENN